MGPFTNATFPDFVPVESQCSAKIGHSQSNEELVHIYKHFVDSDDEDTHLPDDPIYSQFWRMNTQLRHLNATPQNLIQENELQFLSSHGLQNLPYHNKVNPGPATT